MKITWPLFFRTPCIPSNTWQIACDLLWCQMFWFIRQQPVDMFVIMRQLDIEQQGHWSVSEINNIHCYCTILTGKTDNKHTPLHTVGFYFTWPFFKFNLVTTDKVVSTQLPRITYSDHCSRTINRQVPFFSNSNIKSRKIIICEDIQQIVNCSHLNW